MCHNFGCGWLWLVEKKWRVHVKVTNMRFEFKFVYLILMLPKNFGDCLSTLENISSNNYVGNSCCMLIFVIVESNFMIFLVCILLLFCFVIYSVLIVVWMSDCWIYLQLFLIVFFFFLVLNRSIEYKYINCKLCLIVQCPFGFFFGHIYIYIYIYIVCVYRRWRCKGRSWIRGSPNSDALQSINANIIA